MLCRSLDLARQSCAYLSNHDVRCIAWEFKLLSETLPAGSISISVEQQHLQRARVLQAQNMQQTVRLPVAFVREHLPEVERLPLGDKHIVRVQLVYLPPFAADITPETPAVRVEELNDGVTVQPDRGRGDLISYRLSGLPLTASQAAVNGYYVRGTLQGFYITS